MQGWSSVSLLGLGSFCRSFRTMESTQRSFKIILNSHGKACLTKDPLDCLKVIVGDSPIGNLLLKVCEDHRQVFGNETETIFAIVFEICMALNSVVVEQGLTLARIRECVDCAIQLCCEWLSRSNCELLVRDLDMHCVGERFCEGRPIIFQSCMTVAQQIMQNMLRDVARQDFDFGSILIQRVQGRRENHAPLESFESEVFEGVVLPNLSNSSWSAYDICTQFWNAHGRQSTSLSVAVLRNGFGRISWAKGPCRSAPGMVDPRLVIGPELLSTIERSDTDSYLSLTSCLSRTELMVILCSGSVEERLQLFCASSSGTLIIPFVELRVLEAVSRLTMKPLFSDLAQLFDFFRTLPEQIDEREIVSLRRSLTFGSNLASPLLMLEWRFQEAKSFLQRPFTVLFYSPIEAVLVELEQIFWACLTFLRNYVRDGALVLMGRNEVYISLQNLLDSASQSESMLIVGKLIADAFRELGSKPNHMSSPVNLSSTLSSLRACGSLISRALFMPPTNQMELRNFLL